MKVVQHQERIEPGHLRIAEGPIQIDTRPLDGQPFPDFLILPTVFTEATLYLLLPQFRAAYCITLPESGLRPCAFLL